MSKRLLALALALAGGGCSEPPYRVAAVSGKVTLDGKPLANAFVHFAPIGSRDRDPGPTSQGKTDAEGRYTLRVDYPKTPGAVVGKSRIYITTADSAVRGSAQLDSGGPTTRELVPPRYNQDTILTFEVPREGTSQADFELTSP